MTMRTIIALVVLACVHASFAQLGVGGGLGAVGGAPGAGPPAPGAGSPAPGGGGLPSGGAPAPGGGLPSGGAPVPGAGSGGPGGLPVPGGVPTVPSGLPVTVPSAGSLAGLGATDSICAVFSLTAGTFGADLTKGVCSMAKGWLKGVQGIQLQPPQYRMILTENQRKYFDRVVGCSSISCLCDYWPKCRRFTADLKAGKVTNATEIWYYTQRYGQSTRKDLRAMTDVERRRFFYALNKLKYDKIDGFSKFDILTAYHFFIPFAPVAHFSAGLLPFHREVLKNLEIALRMEHPLAAFPMWDTRLDAEMPNPRDTVLFTDELLGGGEGNVTTGPFSTWKGAANPNFPAPLYQGGVFRAVGVGQKAILFNQEYVDIILAKPALQMLVFCVDPMLDTIHAGIHLYIGGLMADPATSPGEPLFYLLHGFVDNIWEMWRQKHQNRKQRESEYALPCPYNPFDFAEMQLFPFPVKIKDVYSNKYTDEFYQYQESPTCANNCHNSTYLACKSKSGRCMSKVREGGDCSGLDDVKDPCYKGTCQGGKCVKA